MRRRGGFVFAVPEETPEARDTRRAKACEGHAPTCAAREGRFCDCRPVDTSLPRSHRAIAVEEKDRLVREADERSKRDVQ